MTFKESAVSQGTVRWFDAERGFGFLTPDDGGEDIFVHASEIVSDDAMKQLREGQEVEFEVGEGDRGPQARRVRVTGDAATAGALGELGTVAWYEPAKGYGFINPDDGGPEMFVHSSAIVGGGVIVEGQRVAYLVVEGDKGPQADHLLPLKAQAGAQPAPSDGADGTVLWYDADKGFGFITPDSGGENIFVHARALTGALTELFEDDRVTYDVVVAEKGPQARDVRTVRGARGPGRAEAPPRGRTSGAGRSGGARDARGPGSGRGGEGVVARYDADRGFGFISPDDGGSDLFVHVSVVRGEGLLEAGDRVRYAVRQSDRGPQADRVERL